MDLRFSVLTLFLVALASSYSLAMPAAPVESPDPLSSDSELVDVVPVAVEVPAGEDLETAEFKFFEFFFFKNKGGGGYGHPHGRGYGYGRGHGKSKGFYFSFFKGK